VGTSEFTVKIHEQDSLEHVKMLIERTQNIPYDSMQLFTDAHKMLMHDEAVPAGPFYLVVNDPQQLERGFGYEEFDEIISAESYLKDHNGARDNLRFVRFESAFRKSSFIADSEDGGFYLLRSEDGGKIPSEEAATKLYLGLQKQYEAPT
jgi:hypothetical protein